MIRQLLLITFCLLISLSSLADDRQKSALKRIGACLKEVKKTSEATSLLDIDRLFVQFSQTGVAVVGAKGSAGKVDYIGDDKYEYSFTCLMDTSGEVTYLVGADGEIFLNIYKTIEEERNVYNKLVESIYLMMFFKYDQHITWVKSVKVENGNRVN